MNLEKDNLFTLSPQAEDQNTETARLEEMTRRAEEKEKFFKDRLARVESGQEFISPEKKEKLDAAAKNIIDCFDFNPTKESFLLIYDDKVVRENTEFIEAVEAELANRTAEHRSQGNYEVIVVPAAPNSAAPFGDNIGKKMMKRPVLIITSMSRSHSPETGRALRGQDYYWDGIAAEYQEKLRQFALRQGTRLISITKGHNPYEILTQGAVEEPVELIRDRATKLIEIFQDVKQVHISSESGTDFILSPRPDKSEVEDGRIDKPGSLSNYPIGEWSCSPQQAGANGVVVVDGPIGGNHNLDLVKKFGPLRLEIKEGNLISINGLKITDLINDLDQGAAIANPLIASVVKYLHSGNNDVASFRLAEFAVGTNSQACVGKPDEWHSSSEGEKKYGTIHIAFGSNGSFGLDKNDPNFNACQIHCDFVVGYQNAINVECAKKTGEKFKLIADGQPQGY